MVREKAEMKIIDVSVHQGAINWKQVKASGVRGAIIRAGYGKGNIDQKFIQNIEGAINAEIEFIGVYWFSYAYTSDMAMKEAIFCNEVIEKYKDVLNLGVFYDWEYDSMNYAKKNGAHLNQYHVTEMNQIFCEEMTKLGYIAGYYTNYDYSRNYIDTNKLASYRKWFAWYNPTLDEKGCFMWQYSSSGRVDGVAGNVDVNELIGEMKENSSAAPKTETKSNTEIAREVIEGKWGNGYTRKNRLTKAGYDYEAIQDIVNQMLNTATSEVYIVKEGDTLSEIAERYETTVSALAAKNNIRNVNKIYIGQRLYV